MCENKRVFFPFLFYPFKLLCTFAYMKIKLIAITILFLAVSCRDKSQIDTKAPTIESVTVNGSSENQIELSASSTMQVAFSLYDNMNLSSYTLDIHPADDGHTHIGDGSQGGENKLTSGNWHIQEGSHISGSSYSGNKTIQIPDSVGGTWHIEISAEDAVGYIVSKAISLVVENENLPHITITSCFPEISEDGKIYLPAGESLNIVAMAYDSDNLSSVFIRLLSNTGTLLSENAVPASGNTVTFPANFEHATAGKYRIVLVATDTKGYQKIWDVPVIVQ